MAALSDLWSSGGSPSRKVISVILFRRCCVWIGCAALVLIVARLASTIARAEEPSGGPTVKDPIQIAGEIAHQWKSGEETVTLLRGNCRLTQASTVLTSGQMVIWRRFDRQTGRERLTAYLEDDARLEQPGRNTSQNSLIFGLATRAGVTEAYTRRQSVEPNKSEPLYVRGSQRRQGGGSRASATILPAQFQSEQLEPIPDIQSIPLVQNSPMRSVRVFPRSAVRFNLESFEDTSRTPSEQAWVFSGGIVLMIEGVQEAGGTIDLSADQAVVWTQTGEDLTQGVTQARDVPFQVYLEGNIIVRQGTSTLRASQAFYDARSEKAVLLNAEVKTRLAGIPVPVRVRADRIRQLAKNTFQAERAYITTSQFGRPGYRLEARDLFIEPRERGWAHLRSQENQDGGEPDPHLWATSLDNTFRLGEIPVFYTPYMSFPAEDPQIPLRRATVRNDQIFGTTVETAWDLHKLFGLERPRGLKSLLNFNYLSERGFEVGSTNTYQGTDRWFLDGAYSGTANAWFIHDSGQDNLGADRLNLEPKQKDRGQVLVRDRQDLANGMTLRSELGYISDRNYLEQYSEYDYDNGKDHETMVSLEENRDWWYWSVMGRYRLNDFFNETSWLPRADLDVLSLPLFDGRMTFSEHAYIGYANQRIAEGPSDPMDKFSVLPYEGNADALVMMGRYGVDAPMNLGPFVVVPYAVGEGSFWSDSFTGESVDRYYGTVGVRGSIEATRIFSDVRSDFFNLNGLAHKMVLDADYSLTESSESLDSIPQFNEFDDNAQEQFRRRLLINTFGGALPAQYEPRFFGVRSGAGQTITSPYHELVDDQHVLRLGWRHRLQTKVGPANNLRIKNWMTLDLETAFFPNPNRDNFGESFGLYGARYAWNFSDRTSLFANSYFDTFDNSYHTWSVGINSQRTTRGSVFVWLRNITGTGLDSQILTAGYQYQLSPKWVTTLTTAYDLGEHANRGQSITLSRLGADFNIHLGTSVDPNKENFSVGIAVEPRFIPGFNGSTLGQMLGTTPTR